MVAAAVAGGMATSSLVGGVMQSSASKSAAGQAAAGAQKAADTEYAMYQQARQDLNPYNQAGQKNLSNLADMWRSSADQLGQAYMEAHNNIPVMMTQKELEQQPGYQFNLAQGEKAVQSSAAAKGLGVSSSAMHGAANYATGLADSYYNDAFNQKQSIFGDYLQMLGAKNNQLNTVYNQMMGPAQLGESAAAQEATAATTTGHNMGNDYTNAGNAQAAGTMGSANAWQSALKGITGAGMYYGDYYSSQNKSKY